MILNVKTLASSFRYSAMINGYSARYLVRVIQTSFRVSEAIKPEEKKTRKQTSVEVDRRFKFADRGRWTDDWTERRAARESRRRKPVTRRARGERNKKKILFATRTNPRYARRLRNRGGPRATSIIKLRWGYF